MSMLSTLASQLRPALSLFLVLTVVTGLAYPAAVTGLAGALFPAQAAGSLIERGQGPHRRAARRRPQ